MDNSGSKNLRLLYRSIQLAKSSKANYIISGNPNDLYKIRHPRGLISICIALLDLPIYDAKQAFGYNVISLIDRAKNRNNKDIYENGFQLIKKREK